MLPRWIPDTYFSESDRFPESRKRFALNVKKFPHCTTTYIKERVFTCIGIYLRVTQVNSASSLADE